MATCSKIFNITILGAPGVGKTSIASQLLYQGIQTKNPRSPCDVHERTIIINNTSLLLRILDTTDYHEFPAMRQVAFNCSDAFIIVSSLTDENSFNYARWLSEEIRSIRRNTPVLIVGKKSDLRPDMSLKEKIIIEAIVNCDWGWAYIQTSAINTINVPEIYNAIFSQKQLSLECRKPAKISKSKNLLNRLTNRFSKRRPLSQS